MRRAFGLWFWSASAILMVGILAAWAAYLETDGTRSGAEVPSRVLPSPPDDVVRRPPEGSEAVRGIIRRLDIGDPVHVEGVTVFFLTLRDGWDSGIRTLDDALRAEALRITEKAEASVPEVFVDNTGRWPVFLVSGELLLGGRQNRIVRQDVLVPTEARRLGIPVYCGEKERWLESKAEFSSAPAAAEPELRKSAVLGRAQTEIWDGIEASMKRAGVRSETRDYRVVHDAPEAKRGADELVSACRRQMPRRTVGMVVASRRRILGADLFEDPAMFAALWEKLVRGYAMGTGFAESKRDRIHAAEVAGRDVRSFLGDVQESTFASESTPGVGRLLSIRGAASGAALVWDGHVVHVVLFSQGDVRPVPQPILR